MLHEIAGNTRRREARMVYHPIVELASHRRLGAEAWASPNAAGGGGIVLRLACLEAVGWRSGRVGVNVDAAALRDGMVLRHLAAALDESGLEPGRLDLEFAEPVLADIDVETLLTLAVVRDLGVGVVLDGFGTGGASLRMLKRLPLTGLKLDSALVYEAATTAEDADIVRAVVGAARALGFGVTACGLHDALQCRVMAACGCEAGQGPLFTNPPSACDTARTA